jgi:hypothetical protein
MVMQMVRRDTSCVCTFCREQREVTLLAITSYKWNEKCVNINTSELQFLDSVITASIGL